MAASLTDKASVKERALKVWNALGVTQIAVSPLGKPTFRRPLFKDARRSQEFTITYTCDTIGTFSFEAVANFTQVDDAWLLDWNYDLLLPTMTQDDTVNIARLTPTRGEIFTSDRVCVAKNDFAPTIYIDPSAIESEDAVLLRARVRRGPWSRAPIVDILHSDATARDKIAVVKVYSPEGRSVTNPRRHFADQGC